MECVVAVVYRKIIPSHMPGGGQPAYLIFLVSDDFIIHSASAHSAGPFCYGMSVVGLSARLVVTL